MAGAEPRAAWEAVGEVVQHRDGARAGQLGHRPPVDWTAVPTPGAQGRNGHCGGSLPVASRGPDVTALKTVSWG